MEIIRHHYTTPNVAKPERVASVIAGSLLMCYGLRRKDWPGAGLAFLGLGFLRRGITGFCYTYQTLGIRTEPIGQGRHISIPYELGIRVDETITVHRPRAEVYQFWRNLENIPEFMEHVESVQPVRGSQRSHWVVKGPGGHRMAWDAEIVNEVENELIGWRSLSGADVQNAGSVQFKDAAGGQGTEVRVELQYNPPGGLIGGFVAQLFGAEPSQQIHNDLKRLKARLETGQVPATAVPAA